MRTSSATSKIIPALVLARTKMQSPKKQSENTYFDSKYANLEAVVGGIETALNDNGLFVTQETFSTPEGSFLGVTIFHTSGEFIEYSPVAIPTKDENDPQKLKSGITYLRRAQLLAIFNLSEDDDDGNAASKSKEKPAVAAPKTVREAVNGKPNPLGEYSPKVGKFRDVRLSEADPHQLNSWARWITNDAEKNKKPLTGPAKEAVEKIELYLSSIETHNERVLS